MCDSSGGSKPPTPVPPTPARKPSKLAIGDKRSRKKDAPTSATGTSALQIALNIPSSGSGLNIPS